MIPEVPFVIPPRYASGTIFIRTIKKVEVSSFVIRDGHSLRRDDVTDQSHHLVKLNMRRPIPQFEEVSYGAEFRIDRDRYLSPFHEESSILRRQPHCPQLFEFA